MSSTAPFATADTRTRSSRSAKGWLSHDMTPREPYDLGHEGPGVVGGLMTHTVGRGTSDAPSYNPTTGQPTRSFNRKGFVRNPDLQEPRKPHGDLAYKERYYGRMEAISKLPPMPEHYKLGEASQFMHGVSSPARREHVFALTMDDYWEPVDKIQSAATDSRNELRSQLQQQAEERARQRAADRAREAAPPASTHVVGPWSVERGRVGSLLPVAKVPTITRQLAKWEEDHTAGSEVGQWYHKPGGGAPVRGPDGAVVPNRIDPEVHLHNELDFCAESGAARNPDTQAQRRQELETQIAENRERRRQERRRDNERVELDDGPLMALGHQPLPNVRPAHVFTGGHRETDAELGEILRAQAREQRALRESENNAAKCSDVNYTPFDHGSESTRRARDNRRVAATKAYGMSDPVCGTPVEGASLVNQATWHMPSNHSTHLPRSLIDENRALELAAQAQGESVWGKPGSGAPNRNQDGTIKTVFDRARNDQTRDNGRLAREQASFVREHDELKKRQRDADKALNRGCFTGLVMTSESPGSRRAATRTLSMHEKDMQAQREAAHLTQQINSKLERQEFERRRSRADEDRHNRAVTKWQGASDRRRYDPITQELTGKLRRDPIIHIKEMQGRLRMTESDKQEYRAELDQAVAMRNEEQRTLKERRVREEMVHARTMEAKFAGEYVKQSGRRRALHGDEAEYKMCLHTVPNLS